MAVWGLTRLFVPGARLGRWQFWIFLLNGAVLYILAALAGRLLGWPLEPIAGLLLLPPLMAAGQQRLRDVGGDPAMIWAFSAPFAVMQLAKLVYDLVSIQPTFPVVQLCRTVSVITALVLVHYWIRPGKTVQT